MKFHTRMEVVEGFAEEYDLLNVEANIICK
jgi:hypothetical protein